MTETLKQVPSCRMRSRSFSPRPAGQQPCSFKDTNPIKRTAAARISAGFGSLYGPPRQGRRECVELERLSG